MIGDWGGGKPCSLGKALAAGGLTGRLQRSIHK